LISAPSTAAHVRHRSALPQPLLKLGQRCQPDRQQKVLEPARRHPLGAFPGRCRIGRLRDAAPVAEGSDELIDQRRNAKRQLIEAADEGGTAFGGERGCVLGRKREAP
jgi:hypothetical protein